MDKQVIEAFDTVIKDYEIRIGICKGNSSLKRTLKSIKKRRKELIKSIESKEVFTHNFKVGDVVEHLRFGVGTVLEIKQRTYSDSAKVDFSLKNGVGVKNLLLKFAKLKKLK